MTNFKDFTHVTIATTGSKEFFEIPADKTAEAIKFLRTLVVTAPTHAEETRELSPADAWKAYKEGKITIDAYNAISRKELRKVRAEHAPKQEPKAEPAPKKRANNAKKRAKKAEPKAEAKKRVNNAKKAEPKPEPVKTPAKNNKKWAVETKEQDGKTVHIVHYNAKKQTKKSAKKAASTPKQSPKNAKNAENKPAKRKIDGMAEYYGKKHHVRINSLKSLKDFDTLIARFNKVDDRQCKMFARHLEKEAYRLLDAGSIH